MPDVAAVAPVTDAAISALKNLGRPVGDAEAPPGPLKPPKSFFPYLVVYSGTDAITGSDLLSVTEDGLHRIQVTTVGLDRAGVEWLRDQARAVLLDRDLDIDGYAVVWSELIAGQQVTRDDAIQPPRFFATDVVHLMVTPATGGS